MAERKLAYLPDRDAPVGDWRHWLTAALGLEAPWRVEKFLRHGRQRSDGCELVLAGPEGRQIFDLGEQRHYSTRSSLRTAIAAATDGICRMDRLSPAELEDVWLALVAFATVTANQDEKGETADWLEQTLEKSEQLSGYSMTPARRRDALAAVLARNRFDYLAARAFADPTTIVPPRPFLLVDAETGDQWMRVGELATFWRHVLDCGSLSQARIDGRLAAIGVRRHEFSARLLGQRVRTVRLYRVADGEEASS